MKVGVRQLCLWAALGSCVLGGSCQRGDSASRPAAGTKSARPAAEESLDFVMETFRRRMEDTPIGFVVTDANGRSTLVGTNKVSYELIRPTTPAESYKAVVTVVTRSSYSIKRSKDNPPEDGSQKSKDDASPQPGDTAASEVIGTNAAGPAPAEAAAGGEPASTSGDVVARRPDEKISKYELLYKDGKWVLTTELNKETEQSIQNAFHSALAVQ